MYHYVRPKTNDEYENIKSLEVNEFEKQIKYFKKNFKIIGIDELLTNIHNEKNSDNTILLTFDDGLKDHYEYVYPILKDYQIKGIFFPSVEPLIENNVLDVHKIQFILAMFKEPEKIILECKNLSLITVLQ